MKYSVLMSLYWGEKPAHLHECFVSLFRQTAPADEIVVVLDGEIPEDLRNVLDFWIYLLPVQVVAIKENVGLGKALNFGLNFCANEWIFRMDTDDICRENRFEKQISYLNEHPNTVLLGGQINEFEGNIENLIGKRAVPLNSQSIRKFAKRRSPFNHMTVAYKKSQIQCIGGYEHHLFMEDYNLWLRMIAANCQVANLDDVLVYARAGGSLLSRRRGIPYIKSEWKLYKLKTKLKINGFFDGLIIFLSRSLSRIMPKKMLKIIYYISRNTVSLHKNVREA